VLRLIRIALCDDDKNILKGIEQYLEEKNQQLQDEVLSISFYRSGVEFLHDIEKGTVFHIIFMDIEMAGLNGVKVGQLLRQKPNGRDSILIYISSHETYFRELVHVGVFGFIGKPIQTAELDELFDRALGQAIRYKNAVTPRRFFFKHGTDSHSVRIDEIVFMKNVKRVIELYIWEHTGKALSRTGIFYSSISAVLQYLPESSLVQCERSYIVNLDYVQRMEKDAFVLRDKDKTKISIGRTYQEKMKKTFFAHQEGTAWMKGLFK